MSSSLILSLDSSEAALPLVGGKGMNLALLAANGFAVPPGFLVTTVAYAAYVQANGLDERIRTALASLAPTAPDSLQHTSETIRAAFATGTMPPELAATLRAAYEPWRHKPVAVRSSATAEDLPDLSFAGQQDTILNVLGEASLLAAIVQCWSSLWTARAIGYRARNGIGHHEVALAVVVQQMVQSNVSGVLFTANPLTGRRSEAVIDATYGLGEALVSGQVEPDQYIVDVPARRIVSKRLGAKALAIQGQEGGGTTTVYRERSQEQAIPDDVILQVAELGRRTAEFYHAPQDIEWGWAEGQLYLLQSRPITSLYPLPEGVEAEPLRLFFSFGAVQGMLEPITPLGRDLLKGALAGLATAFGRPRTLNNQRVVYESGERLFLDFTALMRHPIGRRLMLAAMRLIEPGTAQAIMGLWQEPELLPERNWLRPLTFYRIFHYFGPMMRRVFGVLRWPDRQRRLFEQNVELFVVDFDNRMRRSRTLTQRLQLLEELMQGGFAMIFPNFLPLMAGGMSMLNLLTKLANSVGHNALLLTRGLPHNVTTEMDLALWQVAQRIRAESAALALFQNKPAAALSDRYLNGELPWVAQTAVSDFLDTYGMRGVGEIDLGRQRWREEPAALLQSVCSYLEVPEEQSPPAMFAKGRAEAETAVAELCNALRRTRAGVLKARVARFAASRMRALAGVRESPKFTMIRLFGIVRAALLASGQELAATGVLILPDDIFYLTFSELQALGRELDGGMSAGDVLAPAKLVAERRAAYVREQRRRQIPRLLLSDGQAFYEGIAHDSRSGDLVGSPVSPGVAEGSVRIVFDPQGVQLVPGEILVCPGTDPAWTPLFLAAGGLITEVGGMMTHGSVVAREYGIPAVVGVHQATQRLQTGQRIRLDGSAGSITILAEE